MEAGAMPDLQKDLKEKIHAICEVLLKKQKLITTKSVLLILAEANINVNINNNIEELVAKFISSWRLSKITSVKPMVSFKRNYEKSYRTVCQKYAKQHKQLISTTREVQLLKAKIKALNSFYNRQRQEFIMRIEGMLYK